MNSIKCLINAQYVLILQVHKNCVNYVSVTSLRMRKFHVNHTLNTQLNL